jgi:hypothetical protein
MALFPLHLHTSSSRGVSSPLNDGTFQLIFVKPRATPAKIKVKIIADMSGLGFTEIDDEKFSNPLAALCGSDTDVSMREDGGVEGQVDNKCT